jgi:hypothetical protein
MQFSLGNNVLVAPASQRDGVLSKDTYFFNSVEEAYLEEREPISTLKT